MSTQLAWVVSPVGDGLSTTGFSETVDAYGYEDRVKSEDLQLKYLYRPLALFSFISNRLKEA
jgi:hypothetical protein